LRFKRSAIPLCFLMFTLMCSSFSSVRSVGATPNSESSTKVGVYYYVWYGKGGYGVGRHWNDTIHGIVVDKPLNGYYDSLNVTHVRKQIQLMKDAGIDFVIISWWGQGSYEDNATEVWLEANIAEGCPLQFAIMVELYTKSPNCQYIYNYIFQNYANQCPTLYLQIGDRFVLCWFNLVPPRNDSRFTDRIVGQKDGMTDWVYYPELGDNKISSDGCITVSPRWDNYYLWKYGGVSTYSIHDRNYTEGMYGKEWQFVLANQYRIKMVIICSWNEYHERTMIEPHFDTSNPDVSLAYTKTVNYIKELKGIQNAINYISNFMFVPSVGLDKEAPVAAP